MVKKRVAPKFSEGQKVKILNSWLQGRTGTITQVHEPRPMRGGSKDLVYTVRLDGPSIGSGEANLLEDRLEALPQK